MPSTLPSASSTTTATTTYTNPTGRIVIGSASTTLWPSGTAAAATTIAGGMASVSASTTLRPSTTAAAAAASAAVGKANASAPTVSGPSTTSSQPQPQRTQPSFHTTASDGHANSTNHVETPRDVPRQANRRVGLAVCAGAALAGAIFVLFCMVAHSKDARKALPPPLPSNLLTDLKATQRVSSAIPERPAPGGRSSNPPKNTRPTASGVVPFVGGQGIIAYASRQPDTVAQGSSRGDAPDAVDGNVTAATTAAEDLTAAVAAPGGYNYEPSPGNECDDAPALPTRGDTILAASTQPVSLTMAVTSFGTQAAGSSHKRRSGMAPFVGVPRKPPAMPLGLLGTLGRHRRVRSAMPGRPAPGGVSTNTPDKVPQMGVAQSRAYATSAFGSISTELNLPISAGVPRPPGARARWGHQAVHNPTSTPSPTASAACSGMKRKKGDACAAQGDCGDQKRCLSRTRGPFAAAIQELTLPGGTAAMLAEQGIDDVNTLLLYSANELAEEVGLKGGHARKLLAHFAQLDGARTERS